MPTRATPTAVVTGANSGIGKETAAALAACGMQIVMICRNLDGAHHAAGEIQARTPGARILIVETDLARLDSVERCADELVDRFDTLDVLVNNAGGFWSERSVTVDGFEHHFGVNYLSHYLLTTTLLTRGVRCRRVINVSSRGHRGVKRMNWDDLQLEGSWRVERAYGQSKLAMILFTRELARRVGGWGTTTHAVLPSLSRTNLGSDAHLTGVRRLAMRALGPLWGPASKGADTSVFLATDPMPVRTNGRAWARRRPASTSRSARSESDAWRLWEVTEDLLDGAGHPVRTLSGPRRRSGVASLPPGGAETSPSSL